MTPVECLIMLKLVGSSISLKTCKRQVTEAWGALLNLRGDGVSEGLELIVHAFEQPSLPKTFNSLFKGHKPVLPAAQARGGRFAQAIQMVEAAALAVLARMKLDNPQLIKAVAALGEGVQIPFACELLTAAAGKLEAVAATDGRYTESHQAFQALSQRTDDAELVRLREDLFDEHERLAQLVSDGPEAAVPPLVLVKLAGVLILAREAHEESQRTRRP